MTARPCLDCSTPTDNATRCPDCQAEWQQRTDVRRGSRQERGYDAAWTRLSARARRAQPWCTDCGSVGDEGNPLTADHSVESWAKVERGERLTVTDVEVVCRRCNSARAAARGVNPRPRPPGPPAQAIFESHSTRPSRQQVYGL